MRSDPVRDVALIKTDSEPYVVVPVATGSVKVGDEVYAVGSPFGEQLSGTLTRGIVSADRTLGDLQFIQRDVSINPGSSGGPLLDAGGGVIAIAVMKKEDSSGIALFIPIVEAIERLDLQLN